MWDRTERPSMDTDMKLPTPVAPLVELAQEYVRACDHFEQLQAQFHKLNEEMKQTDTARKELREKLLHLINETIEGQAPVKARSW